MSWLSSLFGGGGGGGISSEARVSPMRPYADRTVRDYLPQIEAALAQGDGCYTVDDIVAAVERGDMQGWYLPQSVLITHVSEYPRAKVIHVLLASGALAEIEQAAPIMEQWARANGCTRATLVGRHGWKRSFLTRNGWTEDTSVVLEKRL